MGPLKVTFPGGDQAPRRDLDSTPRGVSREGTRAAARAPQPGWQAPVLLLPGKDERVEESDAAGQQQRPEQETPKLPCHAAKPRGMGWPLELGLQGSISRFHGTFCIAPSLDRELFPSWT